MRTLDGQPLEAKYVLVSGTLPGPIHLEASTPDSNWASRISVWKDTQTPPERWYFIHDGQAQGHAWFEGFNTRTEQRIGFLGRNGFRKEELGAGDLFPFDSRLRPAGGAVGGRGSVFATQYVIAGQQSPIVRMPMWVWYLVSDGTLWEIDLKQRSARALLRDANLASASIIEQAVPAGSRPDRLSELHEAARSADRLWIVDPRSGSTRQFPLTPELQRDLLEVFELSDGLLLRAIHRSGSQRLVWLDAQGNIIREFPDLLKRQKVETGVSGQEGVMMVTVAPIPVLWGPIAFVVKPLEDVYRGQAASYWEAVVDTYHEIKWVLLSTVLLAAAAATWAYRRHRMYGQSGAVAWFVFVLLLGPSGLIAYLLHRRWPVREACPACGQSVPRDRDACLTCGQSFPPPPLSGTEVFA
jgi:hypothetical protein